MPCYDSRNDPDEVYASAIRDSYHNSPVAELLCAQCKALERTGNEKLLHGAVRVWWEEHKERDRKRLAQEKEDREYRARLAEWEKKRPKR